MRKTLLHVKGLGFILWQTRHMGYHVMLGFLWVWVLQETWNEFRSVWLLTAATGSLIPDIDHLNYFFGYGKKDRYTKHVFSFARKKDWQGLFYYFASNHKHNTSLAYHNIYTLVILVVFSVVASRSDWRAGVVFFGAMVSHYSFDIADDLVQLGGINQNWKRWGRPK